MTVTPTTLSRISRSVDTRQNRGIKLRTPRGGWYLMNRTRYFRICDVWYKSGYNAGLRAAQAAILGKATR